MARVARPTWAIIPLLAVLAPLAAPAPSAEAAERTSAAAGRTACPTADARCPRRAARDRVRPRVTFTAPRRRTALSGVVAGRDCRAKASDNRRVSRVVFYLDGRRLRVERRRPWQCVVNTRRLRDGRHVLRAVAYDAAGNRRSAAVAVHVRNAPASRPATAATVSAGAGPLGQYTAARITGTAYYVSASGSDANAGTAPDQAWRTVARANRAELRPGDGVLFEGGQTFSDDTLMPRAGGAPGSPIVYGSYGQGRANLAKGMWWRGKNDLVFQNLASNGSKEAGLQGDGERIVVQGCSFSNLGLAVNSEGRDWTIEANVVDQTGDSGMILRGDAYTIRGNLITSTGKDPAIDYGSHGIYLKASNATIVDNVIRDFRDDGISVRFGGARIERNTISEGPHGISFFQEDPVARTSHFVANDFSQLRKAAIYVPASDRGVTTQESFVISGNVLHGMGLDWLDLKDTTGTFTVRDNVSAS